MSLVDPIRQPQRFIHQADALIRQSLAEPGGPDPFALIDAHLEASFENVLSGLSQAEGAAATRPEAPAPRAAEPQPQPRASAAGLNPYAYGMGAVMPNGMPYGMPGMLPGAMPAGMPMLPYGMLPGMGATEDGAMPGMMPLPMMMPVLPPAPKPVGTTSSLPKSELDPLIEQMSARYRVPGWLIRNVIQTESGGNPGATSPVGAMGLMQLMPGTAREMGVADPYDAAQNLEGGVKYLRHMLDMFGGDVTKAVAAYNAGPGNVQRYDGVPPFAETQAYVKRVLG